MGSPGRLIAVIDVGSNSVRLLVARELTDAAFEVVDEERFDARLGQGQADGELSPDGIERGLRALRIVNEVARSHSPSALVAVGTEALRRAPNRELFLERAFEQTGLVIRVLSGAEEAYASFLGTINSAAASDCCIVDIGGGSLELIEVKSRRLGRVQSAPLGAIYATERFLRSDPPTAKELRSLRKAVRQALDVDRQVPVLYGVGGAMRSLARLGRGRQRYPLRRLHGLVIPRGVFHRLAAQLAAMTADERRRLSAINTARADIIHASAIVIDEVMTMTGAAEMHVSGQGLREGLVWQEIRPGQPVLPDVRAASIRGLARANGVDELTAEPVVLAAASLFTATQTFHGLGPAELELLAAASRLVGIGMHVDYYNRDRHAEYLVHSGDLHGFSHREIVLLAAIVRWAASGTPDLSAYRSIVEPDDQRRVAVLAALLGTARAVHRRLPSFVHRFEPTAVDGRLTLRLSGGDGLDAESHALERQQKRLESVLKAPVEISVR